MEKAGAKHQQPETQTQVAVAVAVQVPQMVVGQVVQEWLFLNILILLPFPTQVVALLTQPQHLVGLVSQHLLLERAMFLGNKYANPQFISNCSWPL
jgi:hypothetical protein